MIDDLYKRSKTLSKACIKMALVLPIDKALAVAIRGHLIERASELSIKCKGLMNSQGQELFLKKVSEALEAADACNYWLEMIKDEGFFEAHIIDPIFSESQDLSKLLSLALKKVKPSGF